MEKYIVVVNVIGNVYEFPVDSKHEAERCVKEIKAKGYRHYEGNAIIYYPNVVNVTFRKGST